MRADAYARSLADAYLETARLKAEALELKRRRALILIAEGLPNTQVAERLGVSKQAVARWRQAAPDEQKPGKVQRTPPSEGEGCGVGLNVAQKGREGL